MKTSYSYNCRPNEDYAQRCPWNKIRTRKRSNCLALPLCGPYNRQETKDSAISSEDGLIGISDFVGTDESSTSNRRTDADIYVRVSLISANGVDCPIQSAAAALGGHGLDGVMDTSAVRVPVDGVARWEPAEWLTSELRLCDLPHYTRVWFRVYERLKDGGGKGVDKKKTHRDGKMGRTGTLKLNYAKKVKGKKVIAVVGAKDRFRSESGDPHARPAMHRRTPTFKYQPPLPPPPVQLCKVALRNKYATYKSLASL